MVGNNEKVERSNQAGWCSAGGDHLLPLGEAERFVRPEPVADHAGVGRVGGVKMGVSPEHPVRLHLIEVRRILLLADFDVLFLNGNVIGGTAGRKQDSACQ